LVLLNTVVTTVGPIPLPPGFPEGSQSLHLLGCPVDPKDVGIAVGQQLLFRPLIGIKWNVPRSKETSEKNLCIRFLNHLHCLKKEQLLFLIGLNFNIRFFRFDVQRFFTPERYRIYASLKG
jgi:hypothetical protein